MPTEFELDEALASAFESNAAFANWFIGRTPFAKSGAEYRWARFDNPWSRVTFTLLCADSGSEVSYEKDCETDVLVVYEAPDGERLALHIENKLAGGSFTPNQPKMYQERKEQWKGRKRLGNYAKAVCVLVAPLAFRNRNRLESEKFDVYVSHEEIAKFVPQFSYVEAIAPNLSLERRRDP